MQKNKTWDIQTRHTITNLKKLISNLSIKVRSDQYKKFIEIYKPNSKKTILDVGVSSDETLKDTNLFERLYPWPKRLTCATIEDTIKIKKRYPNVKVVKVYQHKKLPFENKQFDMVVSWATLEHVGDYSDQKFFIEELLRIGKKIYITTPYRGCVYEPHTSIPFFQWLPLPIFRRICNLTGNSFWSDKMNLNPLYVSDIKNMKIKNKLKINVYKMFGVLPSHIIITN